MKKSKYIKFNDGTEYPIIKEYDENGKHIIVTKNPYEKSFPFRFNIVNSYRTFETRLEHPVNTYSYQTDGLNFYNPLTYIFIAGAFILTFIKAGINAVKDSGIAEVKHMCYTIPCDKYTIEH